MTDLTLSERYYNKKGLCEDTRLSLAVIGQPFVAFVLDATRTPTLTLVQLQVWLDTLSSFAFSQKKGVAEYSASGTGFGHL